MGTALKRVKHRPAALLGWTAAAVVLLLALAPFLLQWPNEKPDKADAIIVLGGGTGDRVAKSLLLYQAGYAKLLVLTGNDQALPEKMHAVSDARADFLRSREVPAERILYVYPSSDSWQEAQSTLGLMQRLNWDNVIVVSDPPHLLRLAYTWKQAFRGQEKSYVLVATEPEWWTPSRWWFDRTSLAFVFSEMAKLGYYVLVH